MKASPILNEISARLFLDHTVSGIDGMYIQQSALFDFLLKEQERKTAPIIMQPTLVRCHLLPAPYRSRRSKTV